METQRTQKIGSRTRKPSKTAIDNKLEDHDYCFKRRADVDSGEIDSEEWEVVRAHQSDNALRKSNEKWHSPYKKKDRGTRTGGARTFNIGDTVLCRRNKEASEYFNSFEHEKYNKQMEMIKEAAPNANVKLRKAGVDYVTVTDQSTYTQRSGPTEGGNTENT